MPQSNYVHFVDGSASRRGVIANQLTRRSMHVEIYASPEELSAKRLLPNGEIRVAYPQQGIIMLSDDEKIDLAGVVRNLRAHDCFIPVIAFTDHRPCTRRIVEALHAGVLDYFCLPEDYETIGDNIETAVSRGAMLARETRARVTAAKKLEVLSRREREVLELVATGSTTKEIARDLNLSPRTVEIHRINLKKKLGVTSVVEAASMHLEAATR